MLYTYECQDHGRFDLQRPMADRNEPSACIKCGLAASRVITGGSGFNANFLGSATNPGYMCPVLDTWIDSKKKRDRMLAETNSRPVESKTAHHHSGYR